MALSALLRADPAAATTEIGGLAPLLALLDAGADVDLPWDRWDVGRRPFALAARCGHLAAYELLAARGDG